MKRLLQLILAASLLVLTNYVLAEAPTTFKDLQNLGKKLGDDWQILSFRQSNAANFTYIYKTREDYLSVEGFERRKELHNLAEVPTKLKQVIFSKQTKNPFKVLFPYIYTKKTRKLIKQCSKKIYFFFGGIQLELDDNPKTSEWYITAPIEACYHYTKFPHIEPWDDYIDFQDTGHNWIVQKQANGRYRILMESEMKTVITNKKHHGYKRVETFVYNDDIYRQEAEKDPKKYCGRAGIVWQYQSSKYQPIKVGAGLGCNIDSEKERLKHEWEVDLPLVLSWLNRYTPEPITINDKKEVIPAKSKRNTQSSFNQDELNTINSILR